LVESAGDLAAAASGATVGGVKNLKHETQRAGRRVNDALIGRSDAEISADVRTLLDQDPQTAKMKFTVKDGQVRLAAGEGETETLTRLTAKIGDLPGVKSVKLQPAEK